MMDEHPWRQRLQRLRQRLRADPHVPARVWARRQWRSLLVLATAVTGILAFDAWLATCGFDGCPSATDIRSYRPAEGSRVVDRAGRLIGRLTYVRRVNVPLSRIPAHVREAFIATEDRRFYHHRGVDWYSAVRAAARNAAALGVREGFSTITMQVARNTFTRDIATRRTLRRKLLELRLSRLIEHSLSKDEILELYLNVIYLGNGTYGVEAASRDLFGKSVARLTLAEGAVLAALPKGPSAYTPRHDPARARARRDLVLALMAREGYISAQRARAAAAQPLVLAADEWHPPQPSSYVIGAVRALVDSVLGPDALDEGDVTVYTTIDATAQRAAERAVHDRAAAIDRESRAWYGRRAGEIEGALVALDPRTGDVRALVGGRNNDPGGFDRALAARRQPGSAFKPFVYAAALSVGFTPASIVDDSPVEVDEGGRVWTPANYGDEYDGPVTMRHALAHSNNAAAVRFSRAVGERRVVAVAHESGITSPLAAVPSIALGALEVTPLELVTAYAPFANGGFRVRPRLVKRIEGSDGTPLWSSEIAPLTRAIDPRDAFQLTSMLQSVVDEGTGRAVRDMGAEGPIAGKTGTTNDGTDVWFVGYTPSIVAGVWFGYDAPRPIAENASGGRLAAPAWAEFYTAGWRQGARDAPWEPPPGLVSRVIDAETGELAGQWCPTTRREWFKQGTEPTQYCRTHLEPPDSGGAWLGRIATAIKRIFKF
ncbi:MAG TPA: PBP1A family penicillin-binding protein [Gemmatimonadaceae bacterium]|nr:PBP1A family penicillin-binding protein [Gemmatimonadaceae bacterium]